MAQSDFSDKEDATGRAFKPSGPAVPFHQMEPLEKIGDADGLTPSRSGRVSSEEAAAIRRASRIKFNV